MQEMGLFEAMFSQRQITRYKSDPVPKKAIEKIIEAATRAPSGGNTQPWEFVVITDKDLTNRIGQIYKDLWLGARGPEPAPGESRVYLAARYVANHMPEVPAMILVCAKHTPGEPIERGKYSSSIWLAVQNLFLAARALGLGTRLTTTHIRREDEIKEMLGIPEHVETMALIPLGYPRGKFGSTSRTAAGDVTSYNRWGDRG